MPQMWNVTTNGLFPLKENVILLLKRCLSNYHLSTYLFKERDDYIIWRIGEKTFYSDTHFKKNLIEWVV